jgi:hypothetical protein
MMREWSHIFRPTAPSSIISVRFLNLSNHNKCYAASIDDSDIENRIDMICIICNYISKITAEKIVWTENHETNHGYMKHRNPGTTIHQFPSKLNHVKLAQKINIF